MADLSKIFVRVPVSDPNVYPIKYDSLSLQQLWETGRGGDVFEWALGKLNSLEGVIITKENLSQLIDVAESLGVGIAKLK